MKELCHAVTVIGCQIYLYRNAIDFRRGIDGLSYLIAQELKHSPRDGIYLYLNRKQDKLKYLSWHKNRFVLCYKRLEVGCFSAAIGGSSDTIELDATEMSWLLAGLEWNKMRQWGELNYGVSRNTCVNAYKNYKYYLS